MSVMLLRFCLIFRKILASRCLYKRLTSEKLVNFNFAAYQNIILAKKLVNYVLGLHV